MSNEDISKIAKGCKNVREFRLKNRKAYKMALEKNLIKVLFPNNRKLKYEMNKTWTIKELKILAKRHVRRSEMHVYELKAYKYARKNKLLDIIFND